MKIPESSAVKPIAVTMGDPAGIGPEIVWRIWKKAQKSSRFPLFFWIGDPSLVGDGAPVVLIDDPAEASEAFGRGLPVYPLKLAAPAVPGKPDPANAPMVIKAIQLAARWALDGKAGGVVTSPIAKYILAETGFAFPGHTEYLAELSGCRGKEVMMLAAPDLKVVLSSVHEPLQKAITQLNPSRIVEVAETAWRALQQRFGIAQPRLALAGLNPHAGENGLLGSEEKEILIPAIKRLRLKGIDILGPFAPDTMFTAASRANYDAAICLYHDQGLIPLKTLDMERGVNITLGLPIIRTSPDHGTAFDIAAHPGQRGKASTASTEQALLLAAEMAHKASLHTVAPERNVG